MAKYLIRKTAALIAAFSLLVSLAILPTIDRQDSNLQQIAVTKAFQDAARKTERENEAQWQAMERRNKSGDYGEVYEQ